MMLQYADFMYNIGMLDEKQRDYFQGYAKQAVQYIQDRQFGKAFDVRLLCPPSKMWGYMALHMLVCH